MLRTAPPETIEQAHAEHTLGKFRLSVTGGEGLPPGVADAQTRVTKEGADSSAQPAVWTNFDFVPGERIRMLKRGLPGGPLAVKVGQSTFALRRFEAALVSIQPE